MVTLSPERELWGFLLLGGWAGLVAYALEYRRVPVWVYGYLVLKVFAAWAFAWVYCCYYCDGDTLKAYSTAGRIWHYLINEPAKGIALLLREFSPAWEAQGWELYYQDVAIHDYDYDYKPKVNYRFARLLVPFYGAVGGGYYGMQGLVALVSGLLWYMAYEKWRRLIPLRGVWLGIWLVWPSSLFWASGLLRDSLALPLFLYLVGWGSSLRDFRADAGWRGIGAVLGLLLLRSEMVPLAVGLGLGWRLRWHRWWQWAGAGVLAWGLLWFLAGEFCRYRAYWLSPKERPDLLANEHLFMITCAEGVWASVWSWTQGAFYGLTGPYIWQARKGIVALAAIEMLCLWGVWLWQIKKSGLHVEGRGRSWFLLGAGVFMVGLMGMAMPFWGTLMRHRLYGLYLIVLGLVGISQRPQEGERSVG